MKGSVDCDCERTPKKTLDCVRVCFSLIDVLNKKDDYESRTFLKVQIAERSQTFIRCEKKIIIKAFVSQSLALSTPPCERPPPASDRSMQATAPCERRPPASDRSMQATASCERRPPASDGILRATAHCEGRPQATAPCERRPRASDGPL